MAERMTRDAGDPRVAYFDHGGQRVTVRLVDPRVPRSGKLSPLAGSIFQVPPDGPTRDPVIVTGWIVPARFEAHGLLPGVVRYSIGQDRAAPFRVVIGDLATSGPDAARVTAWAWRDVPLGKLLRAALLIATADVRYTPPKSGTYYATGRDTKWRDAWGRARPVALRGRAHDRDLVRLVTGRRPKRGDVAHYLSPVALREVAREYAAAPPQADRPGVGIEAWIGARTQRAPGTVRRQITEARKRGYLVDDVPSIAARRAQRAAERKAFDKARKARRR